MSDPGPRSDCFRGEHPGVTVEQASQSGARLRRAHRDGRVLAVKIKLPDLLAALEERTPGPDHER
jgi:hypothetical protein